MVEAEVLSSSRISSCSTRSGVDFAGCVRIAFRCFVDVRFMVIPFACVPIRSVVHETNITPGADRAHGRCSGRWGRCLAATPHRPCSPYQFPPLSSTASFEPLEVTATRSTHPSPSKSPNAMDCGFEPALKNCAGWYVPSALPSDTAMLVRLWSSAARSLMPSPLKSAATLIRLYTVDGQAPFPYHPPDTDSRLEVV